MSRYRTTEEDEAFLAGAREMQEHISYNLRFALENMQKAAHRVRLMQDISTQIEGYLDDMIQDVEKETVKP